MAAALKNLWAKRPGVLRGRSLIIIGGGLLVLLLAVWVLTRNAGPAEPYRTAAIDRGDVTRVVSATGALQPLVSVNVGSTVSGPVLSVDVDFNARVRRGQVLARLDPQSFQQRVTQAQAALSQAQAQLAVAEADYLRYVRLQQAGFASDQLIAQQRAARDTARAAVQQARAALASARVDLDRSVIRSPINGVVVDRQVNVGQSVAASFQAPTLFVIAQDLSQLQANISVDEADIGEISEGQAATFTVDAFPDRQFEARVAQVRQQGVSDQGVVSYTVVLRAPNPDRRLLPGMTANAEIVIERRGDVLRVPNAALRFRPADPALAAQGQAIATQSPGAAAPQGGNGNGVANSSARGAEQLIVQLELNPQQQAALREAFRTAMQSAEPRPGPDATQAERRSFMRRVREAALSQIEAGLSDRQRGLLAAMRQGGGQLQEVRRHAVVWVLRNNKLSPVSIEIGSADNSNTVLLGGGLREGDQVVVGGGPSAPTQNGGMRGPGIRIRG